MHLASAVSEMKMLKVSRQTDAGWRTLYDDKSSPSLSSIEITRWTVIEHICSFFVAFFSATIDGRNLIFGHKLHSGTPYRGKRFWTRQIPTSCLPTLFIHIEHTFCICPFLVAFFSATIDGRNLIFVHKLHIGSVVSEMKMLKVSRQTDAGWRTLYDDKSSPSLSSIEITRWTVS
jgi:hypothetical protein